MARKAQPKQARTFPRKEGETWSSHIASNARPRHEIGELERAVVNRPSVNHMQQVPVFVSSVLRVLDYIEALESDLRRIRSAVRDGRAVL